MSDDQILDRVFVARTAEPGTHSRLVPDDINERIVAVVREAVAAERATWEPVVAELVAFVEADMGNAGEPDADCEPVVVRGRRLLAAIRARPAV